MKADPEVWGPCWSLLTLGHGGGERPTIAPHSQCAEGVPTKSADRLAMNWLWLKKPVSKWNPGKWKPKGQNLRNPSCLILSHTQWNQATKGPWFFCEIMMKLCRCFHFVAFRLFRKGGCHIFHIPFAQADNHLPRSVHQ